MDYKKWFLSCLLIGTASLSFKTWEEKFHVKEGAISVFSEQPFRVPQLE